MEVVEPFSDFSFLSFPVTRALVALPFSSSNVQGDGICVQVMIDQMKDSPVPLHRPKSNKCKPLVVFEMYRALISPLGQSCSLIPNKFSTTGQYNQRIKYH